MSMEAVKGFYTEIARDEMLQKKLQELSRANVSAGSASASEAAPMEQEMLSLAAQRGYHFSLAELEAYGEEGKPGGQELSEDELEAVTGGSGRYSSGSCDAAAGYTQYDNGTVSFCLPVGR